MRSIFFIGAILFVTGLWFTFSENLMDHFAEKETATKQPIKRYPLLLADDMEPLDIIAFEETASVHSEEFDTCDPVEMDEEPVEPVEAVETVTVKHSRTRTTISLGDASSQGGVRMSTLGMWVGGIEVPGR